MSIKYRITDTETVGLNPPAKPASGVVEVAYIEIDPVTLEVIDTFHARVNPGCEIHPKASEVHGIYFDDIKDCPSLEEVFSPSEPVVNIGHNAPYDLKFLSDYYGNLVGSLCTLSLARQFVKDSANHKLQTLADHLGLKKGTAHSALGDVETTLELLRFIVNTQGRTVEQLVAASRKPKTIHTMPFGKFKGKPVIDLPMSYITYFDDKEVDIDLRYSFDQVKKIRQV